ncbi:WxL domain-containing protein [Anaerobacillus sp. MEB173]|uniref:WxL domain-containing protein n=1 Tax=Anaerobacillus sp. MEB173 TaxID=3383345 RepID=UPI003F9357C0
MKKTLFKKVIATTMAFGIAATAFSTQSFASTTSTVTGGDLTGGGVTFAPLSATLNGTQITTSADWTIADITDARGTGSGWNVSMTLAQFKEFDTVDNVYVTNGKALATNTLKVKTVPTIAQKDTTSSETSTITPVSLDTALDTGSTVKLLSAQIDGGMGSFSFGNLGVELTIPANAYAKTYKTEATVSLNTAP